MNVALYARVSTDFQNVNQQVAHLKEYAKKEGYNVVKSFADTESGRKPLFQRKKFMRLLNLSKTGTVDKVLIYNIDRLTRSYYDGMKIEQHFREIWDDCPLESMTAPIDLSTAQGRLMFRMMLNLSCFYVEDMFEKQRIGIARAKAEGKYTGRKKGAKNKK